MMTTTETATEHLRNALAILVAHREYVELPPGATYRLEIKDLRAIEARLRRALEQLDRGNV